MYGTPEAAENEAVITWLSGPNGRYGWPEAHAEDLTFEPLVITVPRARREALLRQGGWQKVTLQFLVRGFDGANLMSHVCFLQYLGPRHETNTARSGLRGGSASIPDFWIKPNGVLRLICIPEAGTRAEGGPVLEGSVAVPARITGAYVAFSAVQDYRDVQVRASTQQEVAEQMEINGSAKFTILGAAEIGGGASSTTGTTRTQGRELTWTVRVAQPGLTITPAAR